MFKLLQISLCVLVLFSSEIFLAQSSSPQVTNGNQGYISEIKPLRVGLKIGTPSFFTIGAEYVTPLLDERVAPFVDFFPLKLTLDEDVIKLSNFEIGSNVYLNPTGKGLYAGLSYFSFNGKADLADVDFDDGTFGAGSTEVKFNTVNLKVGAKLGKTFYFRIELGYGFGKQPETILVTSVDSNSTAIEPIEDLSSFFGSGIPVFNFGFGFGFL